MDWTQIIITSITLLVGGGGIVTLATIRDKKYALIIENITKVLQSNSETNEEWKNIATERADRSAELKADLDKKDAKIDSLYVEINSLRQQLDDERTARAVAEMLKCNETGCTNRKPPFGQGMNVKCKCVSDGNNQ